MTTQHSKQAETPTHAEARPSSNGLLAEAELDRVVGGDGGDGGPGDGTGRAGGKATPILF